MSEKIRIIFDANPLVRQKTGVGYYTEGLILALAKIPEIELVGHYFKRRGKQPQLPVADNISYSYNSWMVGILARALRKFKIRLPWELLARRHGDILLFPDFTTWPSLFRSPKVVTIHDLTYIDHPEYVTKKNLAFLRRYVKSDARRADMILVTSVFTKQRIVDELGIPSGKILVEPIPPPALVNSKSSKKLPDKFMLFISTLEPRKNLNGLLEAYLKLNESLQHEYKLVIVGGSGWGDYKHIRTFKDLAAANQSIHLMGYVDEGTKAALYKNASLVVVPSYYEGFGMPILEALSYGAPVAVSDIAVFREVAGDAAVYFDPTSSASIKNTLSKLLGDEGLRKRQVKKGTEQLKKYSWQHVASDISQRILELVEDKE